MASAKFKSRLAILLCVAALLLLLSPHLLSTANAQDDEGSGSGGDEGSGVSTSEGSGGGSGLDDKKKEVCDVLKWAKCSTKKYLSGGGDWKDIKWLLTEVEKKAPLNKGYFKAKLGGLVHYAFAEAKCKIGITKELCACCLKELHKKVEKICSLSQKGDIKFERCWVKFKVKSWVA